MIPPIYRDVKKEQTPEVQLDKGIKARVICGSVNGTKGPVQDIVTDPEYLDITIPPETSFSYAVQKDHTVFAYIIEGNGYFELERDAYAFEIEGRNYFDFKRDCLLGSESLVFYHDGDELAITGGNAGVRFLLLSGKPIGEPVAWYGPIVMNTMEELRIAFQEFQDGTFLKHHRS